MKILIKYVVILILLIICLSILKNICLFFEYHHNTQHLSYRECTKADIKVYEGIVDSYEGGYDARTYFKIAFVVNNNGYIYSKSFSKKIDGSVSNSYSFHSLLPYDKNEYLETIKKISKQDEYLLIYDDSDSDTIYRKYKVVDEKLFLDKKTQYKKYNDNPEWGFIFNSKPDFLDMFKFWYF